MIVYLFIITFVIFAALNYLWTKQKKYRKSLFIVNSAIAILGLVFTVAAYLSSRIKLYGSEDELSGWGWDMVNEFYKMTTPIFTMLFSVVVLTSLLVWGDKNSYSGFKYFLRTCGSLFSSALILLLGGFYSFVVESDSITLFPYVVFFTLGEAMLFRAVYSIEYRSYLLSEKAASVKKM